MIECRGRPGIGKLPFLEPGAGLRVLSGKADLNLEASRSGQKSPFDAKGRVQLAGLGIKDLAGKKPNMKFDSVALDFAADYSPQNDARASGTAAEAGRCIACL